jgi:hypothetical protein
MTAKLKTALIALVALIVAALLATAAAQPYGRGAGIGMMVVSQPAN